MGWLRSVLRRDGAVGEDDPDTRDRPPAHDAVRGIVQVDVPVTVQADVQGSVLDAAPADVQAGVHDATPVTVHAAAHAIVPVSVADPGAGAVPDSDQHHVSSHVHATVPDPAADSAPDSAINDDLWGALNYDRLDDEEWRLAPVAGQPVICDSHGRLLARVPTPQEMATRLVGWLQSHAWLHGTPVMATWLKMEVYPKFARMLWGEGPAPVPWIKIAKAIRDDALMTDYRPSVKVGRKRKRPTMYVVPDPAAKVVELAGRKRA